jgi:hypothetical protein
MSSLIGALSTMGADSPAGPLVVCAVVLLASVVFVLVWSVVSLMVLSYLAFAAERAA